MWGIFVQTLYHWVGLNLTIFLLNTPVIQSVEQLALGFVEQFWVYDVMLKARHVKVSVSWKSISYRNKSYNFEGKIKATFSSALEHYGSKTLGKMAKFSM